MSQSILVDMHISPEEYQSYYSGSVSHVLATATDGRRVRFPAKILQRMISHNGINGRFLIQFSRDGKFENIQKIA